HECSGPAEHQRLADEVPPVPLHHLTAREESAEPRVDDHAGVVGGQDLGARQPPLPSGTQLDEEAYPPCRPAEVEEPEHVPVDERHVRECPRDAEPDTVSRSGGLPDWP